MNKEIEQQFLESSLILLQNNVNWDDLLLNSKEHLLLLIKNKRAKYIPEKFITDKDIVKLCITQGICRSIPKHFENDIEIILHALENKLDVNISDSLLYDIDFMKKAIKCDPNIFGIYYNRASLNNNREIALEAVKYSNYNISYVHKDLLYDDEIIFEACKNDITLFGYHGTYFYHDKELILKLLKYDKLNYFVLQYVKFRYTDEFMLDAVKINGSCIKYFLLKFKEKLNIEICKKALEQDGWSLKYFKEERCSTLLTNELINIAITESFGVYELLSDEQKTREVTLKFVTLYCNDQIQDDHYYYILNIIKDRLNYFKISEDLYNDKEIYMTIFKMFNITKDRISKLNNIYFKFENDPIIIDERPTKRIKYE
jgi:hypothetical protein